MFSLIWFALQTVLIVVWARFTNTYRFYLKQTLDSNLSWPKRYDSYITLYEAFYRRGDSLPMWFNVLRWKQRAWYEGFVTHKLLPYLNKTLPVKLLRGTEDGIELVKLMEAGADRIFAFTGSNGQRHVSKMFIRISADKYIFNGFKPASEIDPANKDTWPYGVDTPLTAEEVRKIYNEALTEGVPHWTAVANFSTIVSNKMYSDPGEPY